MEKLSGEEFLKLQFKGQHQRKPNRGKSSSFYIQILRLQVGEGLKITRDEWTGYRTPRRICRYIMKKFPRVKYFHEPLQDGTGWGIKRLE
jgi:hypothetical protein